MLSGDLIKGAKLAAEYSGLTPRQIYRYAEQGLIPVIRKGKTLYFRKSSLDEAFDARASNG